jgi:hypothetical protein
MLQFARFHPEKANTPRRDSWITRGIAYPETAGVRAFYGRQPGKGYSMSEKKYRTSGREELKNPDYSHIKRDLRRILLIAGSFVVVMIVLAFILR